METKNRLLAKDVHCPDHFADVQWKDNADLWKQEGSRESQRDLLGVRIMTDRGSC